MDKPAPVDHPIHPLVRARWSPRAFSVRTVDGATLCSLFEAARWAPSGGNEQPWRFLVVTREQPEAFDAYLSTLSPKNQRWVRGAPVLVFTLARRVRGPEGKPNFHALYDLGQAVAWLSVEATARGLRVHQMGVADSEGVCNVAGGVPDEMMVVTAIAVGYPGDPGDLPEDLRERELAPRIRRSQAEFVYAARWAEPWGPAPER
jgi:nitroreductase